MDKNEDASKTKNQTFEMEKGPDNSTPSTSSQSTVNEEVVDEGPSRILIVDDSQIVQESLKNNLESDNYEVDLASSGREALEKLGSNPDLVILDFHMPDLDGLAVLKNIRDNPATCNIPVIMLSARDQLETRISAFKAGADDCFLKPCNETELRVRVSRLLETRISRPKLINEPKMHKSAMPEPTKEDEAPEFFKDFFDQLNDAVFVIDPDSSRFTKVNEKACRSLGYSREELLNMGVIDIDANLPDTLSWEAHVEKARTDVSMLVDGTHKKKDGSTFPVEVNVKYIRVESRDYIIAIARDITERKRAEEALLASEEKYKDLVGNLNSGVVVHAPDTSILLTNPKACELLDLTEDQMLGREAIDPQWKFLRDDRSVMPLEEYPVKLVLDGRKTLTNYVVGVTLVKKNYIRWMLVNGFPVLDIKGDLQQAIISFTDITERKRAEENLRLQAEILSNMTEGIYLIRLNDGLIVWANPNFEQMFGYDPGEMIGKDVSIVNAPTDKRSPEETKNAIMEMLKDTGEWHGEVNNRKKDGKPFWCYANVSLFDHPEHGRVIISVHQDITERKRMEEDILKVEKLESIGVLAGGIAHDFNNILTSLWGNIQLAATNTEEGSENAEILAESSKACQRATELTKQLLTFAKGGVPIKAIIPLAPLIKESCKFSLRGSNVRCDFTIPDDLWTVQADKGQINQVLSNIIINADQAMPNGGSIEVSVENIILSAQNKIDRVPLDNGKYVRISIQDQGDGIPEENNSKIFDPYFTTKTSGSGLGLATCYSIINKHGGHINVESDRGKGATFHVYLPASEKKVPRKEKNNSITTRGKILIMDDEEQIKNFGSRVLKRLGYEVKLASDGAEAIEMYKKAKSLDEPFTGVILDLTVPGGMGGKETIKKLIEIDPDVKAIVASGYSTDPVMAGFEEYGFKGMIDKPFSIAELEKVLNKALDKEIEDKN